MATSKRFPYRLADGDLSLFQQGRHRRAQDFLGAHPDTVDGVAGTTFATWAPNARRVSVIGGFNDWRGNRHAMQLRGDSGVWELFVPGVGAGELYKFEIASAHTGELVHKTDPYGRRFELRPATASVVTGESAFSWGDGTWMAARGAWQHSPVSVYEVHLGSWARGPDGGFLGYRELARRLVDYVRETGFTHIELLPVAEHPLDASWGYQCVGFFAPTSRFGTPDDFRYFVDYCHRSGIGVFLDWVPGHFPRDEHGLARFDGTALYEYADPRVGEHRGWGTLVFDYGRAEVRSFLISSALNWLEAFHVDGLRVDAVASMLYLDYGREGGDWLPNRYGGNENLEAVSFLQELNTATHGEAPGTVLIAEESTAWPQVTSPTWAGGLGFSMKWNMGWMHDTLTYMGQDPVHRPHHHDTLTFSLSYAFSENFVLPFSHDEVVHGKGSLLARMPGDDWQRRANLRLLYAFMYTHPGKKHLFMGCELAVPEEWRHDAALPWHYADEPGHAGIRAALSDLNRLYCAEPALHGRDFDPQGFQWLDDRDAQRSILGYLRRDDDDVVVVVCNFTPVPRHGYRLGVPISGPYHEVFNSDSAHYGGSNVGNLGALTADAEPAMGQPASLVLSLPPLAAVILRPAPS